MRKFEKASWSWLLFSFSSPSWMKMSAQLWLSWRTYALRFFFIRLMYSVKSFCSLVFSTNQVSGGVAIPVMLEGGIETADICCHILQWTVSVVLVKNWKAIFKLNFKLTGHCLVSKNLKLKLGIAGVFLPLQQSFEAECQHRNGTCSVSNSKLRYTCQLRTTNHLLLNNTCWGRADDYQLPRRLADRAATARYGGQLRNKRTCHAV